MHLKIFVLGGQKNLYNLVFLSMMPQKIEVFPNSGKGEIEALFCYSRHDVIHPDHLSKAIAQLQKEGLLEGIWGKNLEDVITLMMWCRCLEIDTDRSGPDFNSYRLTESGRKLKELIDEERYKRAIARFDQLVDKYKNQAKQQAA